MLKNDRYPHVFQPLTIRGLTLKNRLQYAPTVVLKCTPEGDVCEEMLEYMRFQAETGAAYITIGNTPVEHEDSSAWLCELNVTSDRCIHGIHQLRTECINGGAEMSVELAHAGRGSHTTPGHPALAPSKKPLPGHSADDLKEMDRDDMDRVKQDFVDCAVRCKNAGMKMIMIHAAHQNLLAQFVSPESNIRTDEYGGSLENRMRYPLEVLSAVRDAVGEDMVIELRVSAQEDTPGGLELDESIEFMKAAEKYVDIMHVSRGSIHGEAQKWTIPTIFRDRLLNVAFAEQVKKALHIPVAVVGNITSLAEAEDIIANGKADIVVIAKSFMTDPKLVQKSLAGKEDEIRPCTRCDKCGTHNEFGLSLRCAVNPSLGSTAVIAGTAKEPKSVMVIGGGPAGMMAAQTLTEIGHKVTLFEKTGALGGKLLDATCASFKKYLRLYLEWDIRMTERCGADIRLNTEVTPELVASMAPDAVLVACGSNYIVPNIPGFAASDVKPVADVEHRRTEIGKTVCIAGGGAVGMECALELAMEGHDVTVIDMIPEQQMRFAVLGMNGPEFSLKLDENNVHIVSENRIVRFEKGAVVTCDAAGTEHIFRADTLINALGVRPDNTLALQLLGTYSQGVYVVGDCSGPKKSLYDANQEAYYACLRINREI